MQEVLKITNQEPIAQLRHEPTRVTFSVYKKIGWFHRKILKLFFDLDYNKV